MILIKAGEKVGIVAMEIAQRTRVIGVQILKFRGRIWYGEIDFWDVGFWKRFINHCLERR